MPERDPLDAIDPRALGSRLREVREARNLTQQRIAEQLGIARTTVVAIEKGERRLKPQELIDYASLLGQSVSDLLQRGAPAEGFAIQLRQALPAPAETDLLLQIEKFQELCEDYLRLETLCQAPLRRRYPPEYDVEGVDPEMAAEDLAATERRRLDLGEGPLMSLRDILESDMGLRIFQMELPSQIAAMFAYTEPLGGCIAVNLRQSPERRRTSLAHALGHFLTARHRAEITLEHRYDRRPAAERFAEAFARAFLIPAVGLRRRFLDLERERPHGVTQGDLCRLARFFAVSEEVMTRRLEELRLIPVGTWNRLRKEGLRAHEDLAHPEDEPLSARYVALAVEAWQREELSEGQLARFLRTDRVGARKKIQRFASSVLAESDQGDEPVDLGAPLVGSAGR
jgi:Zn-dependent peptidase ImmA (M78 family)/transcriptional regulator with XRE-family HTH domain